jgi:hypothetical protein
MRILTCCVALLLCETSFARVISWTDFDISSWSSSNPTIAAASASLVSGSAVTFQNVDNKGFSFTMQLINNSSGEIFNALGPGVTTSGGNPIFDRIDVIGMNMQHPNETENTKFRFRVSFSTPLSGSIGFGNHLSPVNRLVFGSDHWSFIPITYSSIGGGELLTTGAVNFVQGTLFNPRFQNATYVDWGFDGSTSSSGAPTMFAGFSLDITTVPEPCLSALCWLALPAGVRIRKRGLAKLLE